MVAGFYYLAIFRHFSWQGFQFTGLLSELYKKSITYNPLSAWNFITECPIRRITWADLRIRLESYLINMIITLILSKYSIRSCNLSLNILKQTFLGFLHRIVNGKLGSPRYVILIYFGFNNNIFFWNMVIAQQTIFDVYVKSFNFFSAKTSFNVLVR